MAGHVSGDATGRFWLVAALYGGCFFLGKMRKRAGSPGAAPFWRRGIAPDARRAVGTANGHPGNELADRPRSILARGGSLVRLDGMTEWLDPATNNGHR